MFEPLVCPKMHFPRPAQLTGQNISGQTLLSLGDIIQSERTMKKLREEKVRRCFVTKASKWVQTPALWTYLGQVTVVPNVPLKVLTSIC